jgi:hypothetical protein
VLAKLHDKGIDSYADAVQELKNTNQELYFYTPNHRVTLTGNVTNTTRDVPYSARH